MEKVKCPKVQKLSADMPGASLAQAKKRLTNLRKLTTQSAELGEEIGQFIAKLRQLAAPEGEPFVFTTVLAENEKLLRVVFRDCGDIEFRTFKAGSKKALLVYLGGMCDTVNLELNIMKPLMSQTGSLKGQGNGNEKGGQQLPSDMQTISDNILGSASVTVLEKASVAIEAIMIGSALLLIEGLAEGLSVGAAQYVKRDVSDSDNEYVLRGPNEAFNEVLIDNIVLIRRRSHDTNVKVHILKIGDRTKTSIALLCVGNLVKPGLLEEVKRRLSMIHVDKILGINLIEEFIIDHPWSPFPQTQSTERPDKVLGALYEGRVAIMMDGTAFTLIVPCTYNSVMQSSDDYNIQPIIGSSIRFMRGVSAFIAIYLPALYVAIVSYHPGMLPTSMAISVAELRARSPFPSFLEAVIMEVLLEVYQEAVVRLPKKLAGSASMVGALVIGTTIVQAALINPVLVVVIATTALASFSMPSHNFSMALRWLRIPMLVLASILGLYGVILGLLVITVHLCSLHSFGESYLGGMLNFALLSDWKDAILRLPSKLLTQRPKEFGAQEQTRIGGNDGESGS